MGFMKRAAVLAGQCDEEYQKQFIEGFLCEAFARDYEVCIFSTYRKYMDTRIRNISESYIFELFVPEDYDVIVILRDSIQIKGVGDSLEEMIHSRFHGPVLVVDLKSKYFPSILTNGTDPCYKLISHLIEHHGYKDIAYLTGKRWHEHAITRLDAYKKAMSDHGLTVSEDRIVYGDFWYTSGEVAAEHFISSGKLPEAVACANDQMAIGLCKAFESRGIIIGKDIAVIGFDSTADGRKSPRPITSCILPARDNGIYAARYLDNTLSGLPIEPYHAEAEIFIGESCGCECNIISTPAFIRKSVLRSVWDTDTSRDGFDSEYNSMLNNLLFEHDMMSFLNQVYSYVYQIGEDMECYSLCLCEHFKDMEANPDIVPEVPGMSQRMVRVINFQKDGQSSHTGLSEIFEGRLLLPELKERGASPRAFFFTPFYFENKCFGFSSVSYGNNPHSYDRIYREWVSTVASAFECLRRTFLLKLSEQHAQLLNSKYSRKINDILLLPEEKQEMELVKKILDENLFAYHFQPIIDINSKSIYAYEALMRSGTDTNLSPIKILKYANITDRLTDIEKATFLNVLAYFEKNLTLFGDKKIFINSVPGIQLDRKTTDRINSYFRKYAAHIVVELTEEADLTENEIVTLKERYGAFGVRTALDDYGTGYSNISNLLRYMPNIVKIDRALLSRIQDKPEKRHFVKDIIDFCHQNNILALAEGVETAAELQMCIFLGADLVQGYYTGRPTSQLLCELPEGLCEEISVYIKERDDGTIRYSYHSGQTNRVSLTKLAGAGYTDIVIEGENVVYNDISVIGAPGLDTNMFISISDNYTGRVELENISFFALGKHNCIELGENVNLTLSLKGENILRFGGIHVPASSRITFEGDGSLFIELDKSDFGIGAGFDEAFGTLTFDQDGEIHITSKSNRVVCIGGGYGGHINIKKGKYMLECGCYECVALGYIYSGGRIEIKRCFLEIHLNSGTGLGIGCINGNADTYIENCTVSVNGSGIRSVCIGSIEGELSQFEADRIYLETNIRSGNSVCLGSISGRSEISMHSSRLALSVNGNNALVLGGLSGNLHADLIDCEISIMVNNQLGAMCMGKPGDVNIRSDVKKDFTLLLGGKQVNSMTPD